MAYEFPRHQLQNHNTMMLSPTKLQNSALTSYAECGGPNAYKNMLLYPNWQWPPTPESLSPSVRLPHINHHRFSIQSPLTPATPSTHRQLCAVEPMSPAMCSVLGAVVSSNTSASINVSIPGVTPFSQASPMSSTLAGSKRGRPRADLISTLQYFGSNSTCSIRCRICNRVFPREKSLQAHLRTHTGERPYRCDYPNCTKSFVQSGQLKTHQRLHSGEKPFKCSENECRVRFTHANRHCPEHPHAKLMRDDRGALEGLLTGNPRQDSNIDEWLDKYVRTRLDKANYTQRPDFKRELSEISTSSDEDVVLNKQEVLSDSNEQKEIPPIINTPAASTSPTSRGFSVKRQLLTDENYPSKKEEQQEPAIRIPLSPKRVSQNGQILKVDPRHPVKKRILAYNQMLMKENQELERTSGVSLPAMPCSYPVLPPLNTGSPKKSLQFARGSLSPTSGLLRPDVEEKSSPSRNYSFLRDLESADSNAAQTSKFNAAVSKPAASNPVENTALLESPPRFRNRNAETNGDEGDVVAVGSDRWNGALALMQLASSPPSRKISSSSDDH